VGHSAAELCDDHGLCLDERERLGRLQLKSLSAGQKCWVPLDKMVKEASYMNPDAIGQLERNRQRMPNIAPDFSSASTEFSAEV
jgi:hypothetical protein